MPTLPSLRVENYGGSLRVLAVDNTDLTRGRRSTYLSEDVVSAASTIRVQSVIGFESLTTSSGQVVVIGEIGGERTEIRRTSSATGPAPGRGDITLSDTLQFDHPQDTKVYIVDFNRIDFNYAATAGGTKTTLMTYGASITPDQRETIFRDTTEAANRITGSPAQVFYFARWQDSIRSASGDWSDAIYSSGLADNAVASIKKRALDELGEEVDGNVITHEFLNQCLWEARREYHNAPGKRPFRRKFNVDIGDVLTGSARIALPEDVERPETAENIYGVRVGTEPNMAYYDKKSWDFDYRNIAHSTLDLPYTTGTSTSIWVANGRDFSGSPVFSIEGANVTGSRITGSQNSFTVTAHGSWSASTGSDAWENVTLGLPDKFTVFADPGGSAYIYFSMPFDTVYVDQNIYVDYYRTVVARDSDADLLDEPSPDIFVPYLKAKIKHRKNKGATNLTEDADYRIWLALKAEALYREYLATDIRLAPELPNVLPE